MVAHRDSIRRCAVVKQTVDLCTSPLSQAIAVEYLRSGRYPKTVPAARTEYQRRVAAMTNAVQVELSAQLRIDAPEKGMFLWAENTMPLDARRLFHAAVEQGVLFAPGAAFQPGGPVSTAMRLSFAAPSVDEIREGVSRLARAFRLSAAA
jgi:DNA-binding transcriptional MocR family regulator